MNVLWMLELVFMLYTRKKFLACNGYEPYSSALPTVAYRTDRTTPASLEILNWDKVLYLGDIKWFKYMGRVCVCVLGVGGWCECRYWFIFLPSECGEY
jgi:hypothetical protein